MRPKCYYAHPVRGVWGLDAPKNYIRNNLINATQNVAWLRKLFPDIEWYCPAEHEDLLEILVEDGCLALDDLMNAEKVYIRRYCSGVLAHEWETSSGVQGEWQTGIDMHMPTMLFSSPQILGNSSLIKQLEIFVDEVKNWEGNKE